MFIKSNVLRAALGEQFRPSNEDSVTTEEVGKTADAVVEIERLKQENLDLMEIHALEQDLALIEQDGAALDELSEATDEITEMRAEIESYYEKGGMSASDAHHMGKRLEYINKRLGGLLAFNMPTTESFRGNDADRMTLTASTENAFTDGLKKMWEGFKNMIKKIVDTVKGWFGASKEKNDKVGASLKDTLDKIKSFDEVSFDNVASFKPIFGDAAWVELGKKSITGSNIIGRIDTLAKDHERVVKKLGDITKQIVDAGQEIYTAVNNQKVASIDLSKITPTFDGPFSANSELTKDKNKVYDSIPCLGGRFARITLTEDDGKTTYAFATEVKSLAEGQSADDAKVTEGEAAKKVKVAEIEKAIGSAIDGINAQQNAFNLSETIANEVVKIIDGMKVEQAGENLSDDQKKAFNNSLATLKSLTAFAGKAPVKSFLADGVALFNKFDSLIKAAKEAK